MYARITTTEHSPYRIDEAIQIAKERVVPAAKQQKGYKGYYMLVDRSTGTCLTITLWESEADQEISGENSPYYQEAISHLVPLLSDEPNVTAYEVAIQD